MTVRLAGDTLLLVEFGSVIDPDVNEQAVRLGQAVRRAGVPGVRDVVPGYCSVGIHFDPLRTDLLALERAVHREAHAIETRAAAEPPRTIEIPVRYGGPDGPDLDEVARFSEGKGHQFITANGHKVNCAELGAAQTNGLLQDPSVIEGRDPRLSPHNIIVNLYPTTVMTRNLDVISVRFATPRAVDETEVHYAYFTHEDDDEELTRHRVRQASNLIGPSGFISLEDGAVFNRVQSGSHTPGNVAFQKGVRAPLQPPCALDKGDEAGNLVRWDRYRRSMGFEA